MTVLHATEPATVYLSCWARVDGLSAPTSTGRCIDDRSLVKQLAMRRTLFVFPRDLLPAAWGSASARVAGTSGPGWPRTSRRRARRRRRRLGRAGPRRGPRRCSPAAATADRPREIRRAVPMIDVHAGRVATASRRSALAGAHPARGRGATSCAAQHRPLAHLPTALDPDADWLGDVPPPWTPAEGYAELVRRWLLTFGPGTEDDLVWWLGRPRRSCGRRWPSSAPSRSPSTAAPPAGCCPTTSTTVPDPSRGRRCCRCSTRP